ncbi:MAG: A24 family peptidase [Proteobacteria bacterium]|nr:A24 family peptidase [Pseudomonadota bacterium]
MEFLNLHLDLLERMPYLYAIVFGLIAGSFANVVIARLPQTLYIDEAVEPELDYASAADSNANDAPAVDSNPTQSPTNAQVDATASAAYADAQAPGESGHTLHASTPGSVARVDTDFADVGNVVLPAPEGSHNTIHASAQDSDRDRARATTDDRVGAQGYSEVANADSADSSNAMAHSGLSVLVWPGSACPRCEQRIRWYDNIPLLSFILLAGRCRHCRQRISLRYPLVELAAAVLVSACVWRFGASWTALAWSVFCLWLLVIAAIDAEHMLIPDTLSLSGVWLGLLLSCTGVLAISPVDSIIGAAAGYGLLYSFYWLYWWLAKREGLGYGDFKLLAMIGAWTGYSSIASVVFYASLAGSIAGLALYWRAGGQSYPFAFGPWLAAAALAVALFPHLAQVFALAN